MGNTQGRHPNRMTAFFLDKRREVPALVTLQEASEFVAIAACGLFAGASLYINLVEHPARMECGAEIAVTVFGPSYRRAARIQVFFAALGFIAALAAWLTGDSVAWLIGGLVLGGVIPFTLIFIMPTNRQLLSPAVEKTSPRTRALLEQWGRLHAVRSGLSLAALFIFIASA